MSLTFDFLVQLGKLCRQELSKRASTKSEPGTGDLSPANRTCEISPSNRLSRSAERCDPSTQFQGKHVRSKDTLVALQDPLHQVIIKKEDPENVNLLAERFRCPNCKFIATSHPELFTHVTICTNERQDGCPLCPEGAGLGMTEVDEHIKSVHIKPGELEKSDDGFYHCKKCNKVLKYFSHLKKHIVTLKHQGMDRCMYCGIVLSLQNMEAHQKEFHSKVGNGFICQIDGLMFASKMSLDRHMRSVHSSTKQFKCQHCDMAFQRTDSLKKHELTHDDARRFVCCFCDLAFKSKENLKNHMKSIHLTPNKFQCRLCFHSFDDENRLDIHVKMFHEGRLFPCQICGQAFNNYSKKERHLQAHLNSYKNKKVKKEKKKVPKERKRTKKERSPVEFDSSAEEDENIYKRRKDTKKVSRAVEFDSSAEEDENIDKGRKDTKKRSRTVEFDSSAEEDENIDKGRKDFEQVNFTVESDSEASSSTEGDRNTYKKREDTKVVSQSDAGVNSSAEEEVCPSFSPKDVVGNVIPSKTDSRRCEEAARAASLSSRKRKENCENRSPNSSGVARKRKKWPEASSSLKADRYSKSCLSTKNSNVVTSKPLDGSSVATPSKRVRISRAKGKLNKDQDQGETGTAPFAQDELKPALTIPEDTLFLYVNSPDGESIDSFSSLRPESLSESALYIDVDNIPQCDRIDIRDLSAGDLCPVEVEYLSGDDANRLASANDSGFYLTQPIKVELDSGVSCGSVDAPPRKKAPAKKKSTPVPRRKLKKYPDSDRKVIVKNFYVSNDDDFVLPEFVIDEDDD